MFQRTTHPRGSGEITRRNCCQITPHFVLYLPAPNYVMPNPFIGDVQFKNTKARRLPREVLRKKWAEPQNMNARLYEDARKENPKHPMERLSSKVESRVCHENVFIYFQKQ